MMRVNIDERVFMGAGGKRIRRGPSDADPGSRGRRIPDPPTRFPLTGRGCHHGVGGGDDIGVGITGNLTGFPRTAVVLGAWPLTDWGEGSAPVPPRAPEGWEMQALLRFLSTG
jgi:hypothetical protein